MNVAHVEEAGSGLRQWWANIESRPSVMVGNEKAMTRAEAIQAGERYWQNDDALKIREAALRSRNPGRQVFSGLLPSHDIAWNGEPGYYIFILADRRIRVDGKLRYRVLDSA